MKTIGFLRFPNNNLENQNFNQINITVQSIDIIYYINTINDKYYIFENLV